MCVNNMLFDNFDSIVENGDIKKKVKTRNGELKKIIVDGEEVEIDEEIRERWEKLKEEKKEYKMAKEKFWGSVFERKE